MASWFSNLKSIAEHITNDIAQNINTAQNDLLREQQRLKEEEIRRQRQLNNDNILLPWETSDESKTILIQSLMEEILSLSLMEQNFLLSLPESIQFDKITFNFESFVPIALKLLKLDSNLARMHMKLSPKMSEETFWKHYYYRIIFLRTKVGMESDLELYKIFENVSKDDIIYTLSSIPVLSIPALVSSNSIKDSSNKSFDDAVIDTKDIDRRNEQAHLAAEVEAELDGSIDDILDDDIDAELEKEFNDLDDGYEDLGDEFGISYNDKFGDEEEDSYDIKNKSLEEQIKLELSDE